MRRRVSKDDFGGSSAHWTRDIAFGPDGTLYLAIGSGGNVETGEPETRATVQVVNRRTARSPPSPAASAIRSASPFIRVRIISSSSVNERDGLGDQLVPDYLTQVNKGDFFGWPYAYTGHHPDPTFGKERPDLVAKTKVPDLLFQSHSAPLGLVFYEGSQFPADYKGDAFVSLHGSWNRGHPTGYKVVQVKFANGKPVGGYDNFLTGFWAQGTDPAQVWGRPAGLAVAKDGSLLIADDAGKAVWRVRYTGKWKRVAADASRGSTGLGPRSLDRRPRARMPSGPRPWLGAVAQSGERLVRNEEVSGSIPLSSTSLRLDGGLGLPQCRGAGTKAQDISANSRQEETRNRRRLDARLSPLSPPSSGCC